MLFHNGVPSSMTGAALSDAHSVLEWVEAKVRASSQRHRHKEVVRSITQLERILEGHETVIALFYYYYDG